MKPHKRFDWIKAAEILKEKNYPNASAGLIEILGKSIEE